MGGYKGGRRAWHTKADMVEDCRVLDINRWIQEGVLRSGVPILWASGNGGTKERERSTLGSGRGHVFTWGGRVMSEEWKRAFQTACRNAKLENLRFHDIRHTFVTWKVSEGHDYKRIMAITGHKTFAVFQG